MHDENNAIFRLAAGFINETSEHIFLTGKAGTGKTTFLRYIRENTHKTAVVVAPTGVAAINAGGTTIHSLFQLPFEPYIPGFNASNKNRFRFSKAKLDLLRQLELLIIDEVSMLRADTLDSIDMLMQRIRRNSKPFGGVQVLYIGDLFQLPPIAKEDEWELLKAYYTGTFFFHAKVIQQTQPVYLELKKIYRQDDPVFIHLLNRIRNNQILPSDLEMLNRQYNPAFIPPDDQKFITLTTHNYKADQINNRKLAEINDKESVFTGTIQGEFPDYALPTEINLRLKTGAQIMFIKNDTEEPRRYYNGKIATISRITDDNVYVFLEDFQSEIALSKESWDNIRYTLNKETGKINEEKLGSFSQYPVKLAWAITIHKSQGLTFNHAVIDIGASFAAGQAYVALSRCTGLDGIVLHSKIQPNCILTDPSAIQFSQSEKNAEELEHIFSSGKRKFWAERLLLYFDWKPMYDVLYEMGKLLEDKTSDEFEPARKLLEEFKIQTRLLENTAVKFKLQLSQLTAAQEKIDMELLQERCQKAILYFHEQIIDKILKPLQYYIIGIQSHKRIKTFVKNLMELEEDIVLFIENMKRVRYNNIPLATTLTLEIPKRNELFDAAKSKPTISDIKKEKTVQKPKTEKGATQLMTLAMHKEGLSIEEIASQRTLASSTIETHLAVFILSGEISALEFLSPDDLNQISPILKPFLNVENPPFKLIMENLGHRYSYGQLKMAFNHFVWTISQQNNNYN